MNLYLIFRTPLLLNMKKILSFIVVLAFGVATPSFAQSDGELASLIEVVRMLRETNETNFTRAISILSADIKWTPMNETGAVRPQECRPADKVKGFRLNRILSKAESNRKYVSTHGDMVNGENASFDYSLYERTLKAHSKAEYRLRGRLGRQTFVVVPYHIDAVSSFSVSVSGKKTSTVVDSQKGTISISFNADKSKDDALVLVVGNNSSVPQPFVIINHNSRKQ